MSVDFSSMMDDDDEAVINPRDIFLTLDKDPRFSFPRDIQSEVMKLWHDEYRDEKDSIIKLNVGSGKTVVGLLILQSSLNENIGPALYVVPDKQLAQQVIQEAKALGIEVTEDPKSAAYEAGEAICVVNVYKVFNGRSVFGVGSSKIKIGSVIVDDAHACVSTISDQFRITLGNGHEAYQEILTALKEDLKAYSSARFLEVKDGDPRAYIEVPFWSWATHQDKILTALHDHREEEDLVFSYPLLKEALAQCRCVIGGQKLEIEPAFPITDLIQSFRRAKRRIYMTATLSDDSVVVTHFGANQTKLKQPIVPISSQSMGERMILMPQEINPNLATNDVRSMLVELAAKVNVVVVVPSELASKDWKQCANQVLMGENVTDGVEKLRHEHVGLTVLVNRYDGIDLPQGACRILVIAGLPEVSSYSDLIDSEVLSESDQNLRRQIERIEQGMGRGVRSNDDHCAVLLLGAKLTGRLRSPEGQNLLTPATRAQLELSRKMAKQLESATLEDIKNVILQCLNRDPAWVKISKKALVNIKPDEELRLDDAKIAIRKAFDCARSNQNEEAVAILDKVIDASDDDQLKAWLLSKKAMFQHRIDPQEAQRTLIAAHRIEPSVVKPLHGVSYKKLTVSAGQQASDLIENHENRFLDTTSMKLFAQELCSDLQFLPNTSDKFEATINELAWFLGLSGQRPEKDYKEGPDNLWALPNGDFLVIECKNGVTSTDGISKKDAGQLGQSVEWFNGLYPASRSIPIIIHPEKTRGQGASVVNGMRVIEVKGLEKLKSKIRELADQLANPDISSNATKVANRLAQLELNADAFVNAFSSQVK